MGTLTSSRNRRLAGTGLVLAAAGIVIQIAGGADYPVVPPGLVILVVAAALVLFAPWRWTLGLATLATLFISVGGVLAPGFRDQLGDPAAATVFTGSVVQVIGLLVAVVFCIAAVVEAFSSRRTRTLSG